MGKLIWKCRRHDCGARIAVAVQTPSGYRYAVSMPAEAFDRRAAQASIREWLLVTDRN